MLIYVIPSKKKQSVPGVKSTPTFEDHHEHEDEHDANGENEVGDSALEMQVGIQDKVDWTQRWGSTKS